MKRSMDDLLRETLRAREADPAACLDADGAATFVEGVMSPRERAIAQEHLADCPRCQALVAAMVRTTPAPAKRIWWRRPAVAWLAPLTAAATALAIWINVRDNGAVRREAAREVADASAVELRPTLPAAADPPRQSAKADAPLRDAAPGSAAAGTARAGETNAAPAANASAPSDTAQTFDRLEKPQPATPSLEPQASAADAAVNRPAAAAVPAPPSAAAEAMRARAFASRADAAIISLNRTSQWRLGVGGEVQHSADGGMTWQAQGTGVTVAPTAGFSPAPSVCWLVGPAGLVLITTDEGRSWRRLPFPIDTDLASVRATDHLSATIAAADGRTFVTSDGGATWRR